MIVAAAVMGRQQVGPIEEPEVMASGFVGAEAGMGILERAAEEALFTLEEARHRRLDWGQTRVLLKERTTDFLYRETRSRPTVLVHLRQS